MSLRLLRTNPRSQEELAQLYLKEFAKYQAMAAVTGRLVRELSSDPGDFDTLERQYKMARAAELAQLRKHSDIFGLLTQDTKDKYLRARVSRNPSTKARSVKPYPSAFIQALNTLIAPLNMFIDGSIEDGVREGIAADVSTFKRDAKGNVVMGGEFAMLLSVGSKPQAEVWRHYNDKHPAMTIPLTGDAQADAETVFKQASPILTGRSNPARRARRNPKEFVVYHADHGISPEQMEWIKAQIKAADPKTFFVQEIQIPGELGMVRNAMYGPAAGDPPVPESEVSYRPRGDRPWSDRVVSWPTRPVNYVQAIGMPDQDNPNKIVLFTVYGGPLAPQHPDDPGCRDVSAAKKFWSQHALSLEQWGTKKNPKKKKYSFEESHGTPRMTVAELMAVIAAPYPSTDSKARQLWDSKVEACREELDRR